MSKYRQILINNCRASTTILTRRRLVVLLVLIRYLAVIVHTFVVLDGSIKAPQGRSVKRNVQLCAADRIDIIENRLKTPNEEIHLISDNSSSSPHIIFPGGGIFFYYQAGLITYLRENNYDLSTCSFSGASAGALTATLTATNVNFYEATDLALSMAADAGVWDRQSGLQGIWGPLIEDWLDTLLPQSIESIQGKLHLLVTPIPSFGKERICTFHDRNDLIKCNMASVHLPWFLDGKLTSNFRNKPHIDGSFLSKPNDYIPKDEMSAYSTKVINLDHKKDPSMRTKGGLDVVEALSPDDIWDLIERGKKYGKTMDEQGIFDTLKKL